MTSSRFSPIDSAKPVYRSDGALFSPEYDDVYASSAGALEQARHVFLAGNRLPDRWRGSQGFTIVETGFGCGLNFLATWQSWLKHAPSDARLNFVSVELHPLVRDDLARIHARYPELRDLSLELCESYPSLVPGFHRLHLAKGRLTLTLLFGEVLPMLRQLDAQADAFYLDGFSPQKNPQMWGAPVFGQLGRLCAPGATVATWSVAGSIREALTKAGFIVEKRPGFDIKRDMLIGRTRVNRLPLPASRDQRAIVIGAGLAGTACANRLAARGWQVSVIERHASPARETSGVPAGLVRPVFSLDWNLHSRFTTAAYLYALRHERALADAGHASFNAGGVLQICRDAEHFEKQQRMVDQWRLPADLVQIVSEQEAAERAGYPVAGPGWWLPGATWAKPANMCRSNFAACPTPMVFRFGVTADQLCMRAGIWNVLDKAGQSIAEAPVVVIANAIAAQQFSQAAWLPLRTVRGQISVLPSSAGMPLKVAVCREGYVTPACDGVHFLGSSFNEDIDDKMLRTEDHASNLRRLEAMLPGFGAGHAAGSLSGHVAFRTMARDRLPVIGALTQPSGAVQGLFASLALGSRGMTWAALAGEIVASGIAGDPMPVERDLLAALQPGRFLMRDNVEPHVKGPLDLQKSI
jgi:tRNA 5-methylaminomethyl-2-thiouridine biosynthesis bifunctional protein